MWLKSEEKYMQRNGEHHSYFGLIYIPPKGSSFEQNSNAPPAYGILQQDLADLLAHDGLAIMAGDFNARTGSAGVFANMNSVMCLMPLVSCNQDHTSYCPHDNLLIQKLVPSENDFWS